MAEAYVGPGVMVNSGPIDGIETTEAKGRANPSIAATIDWLERQAIGRESINYRLRDWLISRQRYWGCPIPAIYREDGRIEMVPDGDLPVRLPEDVEFQPTGRSPLTHNQDFLTAVDSDGKPARRETDTMDTFMCSSWYQYRYLSPGYQHAPFDPEEAAYWLPVDVYTGGAEHATMHLLYTRFFTKAMRDMGVFADTERAMRAHGREPDRLFDEPMLMLRNQGQILGEERPGDRLVVDGRWDEEILIADRVRVDPDASDDAGGEVVGELMRRTERLLQVATRNGTVTVEVEEGAVVEIPAIPGDNDVSQLRHHLEIQRMSKSKGNVVSPDELVRIYGADTVRTYLMFAFDWEKGGPWDSRGILGSHRFLQDVWKLGTADYRAAHVHDTATTALRRRTHQTIQKVDRDMVGFSWNTAVAALMSLRNDLQKVLRSGNVAPDAWDEAIETLLLLLAPVAPHITEELWHRRGHRESVHLQAWPFPNPLLVVEERVTMVVQVNGKVRDRVEVPAEIDEEAAIEAALGLERIQEWTRGKQVRKVIARPPKLVNVVVG